MAPAADLILRARDGDGGAAAALIGAYESALRRFVTSRVGPGDDDDDLCQSIFIKMLRGLPSLCSPNRFEPWLFRIARNECADHVRRRRRRGRMFVSLDERHAAVAVTPEPEGTAEAMHQAVAQLSPEQRTLLSLSLEQPRTYKELAGLTQLSVAAVRNRLYRAREQLRKLAVLSLLVLTGSALLWTALSHRSGRIEHPSPTSATTGRAECPWGKGPSFVGDPTPEGDAAESASATGEESDNPLQ